jgi:DNA-binding FrmR family transcriptional regulator
MVEEGQDCAAVVTQLSACKAALDRVGYRLVVAGMRHCVTAPADQAGEAALDADELERLFMKLS